jgi:hypothetical protein
MNKAPSNNHKQLDYIYKSQNLNSATNRKRREEAKCKLEEKVLKKQQQKKGNNR